MMKSLVSCKEEFMLQWAPPICISVTVEQLLIRFSLLLDYSLKVALHFKHGLQ